MQNLLYYAVYGLLYALSLLPLRLLYVLSDACYVLVYHVVHYRRRVVRNNLRTAFPGRSEAELHQVEKRFYHWFCDYVVETVKLFSISETEMRRRMVFKGTEQVDACVADGQSCAVYLGHYCNWEWVASLPLWVSPKGQCGQIYHPLENKGMDRMFLSIRHRFHAECIPMTESIRRVVAYRSKGIPTVIGYISDQKPFWWNIHHWCDFLHHDTPVLSGAERIARKFNQAVFYLDIRRPRRGYYEAELKLVTREPGKYAENEITDIYFRLLERTIQAEPAYWLWTHDRWKRTREEFNDRFYVKNGKVFEREVPLSKLPKAEEEATE